MTLPITDAKPRLLSVADAEALSIRDIWRLHGSHISPRQVNIFSSFGYGHDVFMQSEGMWMTTADGRRILDFTGGFGVLNHGHNHPRILAARRAFADSKRMEVHKVVFSPYMTALAHNVASLLPGDLNKCFFPNSGAEAVEGALKIAYKSRPDRRAFVLHAEDSFHGKLIASGTITGSQAKVWDFPSLPNTASFRRNDLDSVEALVRSLRKPEGGSNVYAIAIEPFHATTMTPCSGEFLAGLRAICDREGIALIFDEVYSGWGKSGHLFAFMAHDVVPDMLCMSKSFGGGKASISGLVVRDPVFMAAYGTDGTALLQSSTYNGFGEECVTALEAVNIVVEEDFPARARHIHAVLREGFERLQAKFPGAIKEVRGQGGFNGMVLNSPFELIEKAIAHVPFLLKDKRYFINKIAAAAVVDEMYRNHGILSTMTENGDLVLYSALPSLIAGDAELRQYLGALEQVLDKGLMRVSAEFVGSKLAMMLKGMA
ncbi:MAG TPA: aminotransferase class III-fold pyridoxal phosphate-dependent enzyme [Candidatus Omnitrophota bacterium]|nr:aminotransferase class III-fold pyridoxal phosphate-dependent enzyme [Candidatus Omnitrophota bacterium]